MTGLGTTVTALAAAAAAAVGGVTAADGGSTARGTAAVGGVEGAARDSTAPTALVIDARLARDGRELVDRRLAEAAAEVRLPRTAEEAATNVRYFAELGYRLVVAGGDSTAAATRSGAPAEVAQSLGDAVAAAGR